MKMSVAPSLEVQIVYRKGRLYLRSLPITCSQPTPAQAEIRALFAIYARQASALSVEQVARIVGGEVVDVNGLKLIKMPDGRLLLKQQAYISYALRSYRSSLKKEKKPLWMQRLVEMFGVEALQRVRYKTLVASEISVR